MKRETILPIILLFLLLTPSGHSKTNPSKVVFPKNTLFIEEPVFNGKMYFYKSDNQFKTTVILVHGAGEDASDIWKSLVPELEKTYKVIYFDLPGFGRSEKKDALYTPQNYAKLIKWICDTQVEGPMFLIGHSLGGAIALGYAGTYPQSLQRLVIVDAAAILHRTAFTKNMATSKVRGAIKPSFFQTQVDMFNRFIENIVVGDNQPNLPKDFSTIYNNTLSRKTLLGSSKKIAALSLIYTDFSEQIKQMKAPVFMVWGENDQIAPLRTGKMLSYCIPGSSLVTMPGLGHCPMIDRPSGFNAVIQKCLTDNPPDIAPKRDPNYDPKSVNLNEKEDLIIEGDYDTITLSNCRNIQLLNVRAKTITINNSWIDIENLEIESENIAISSVDSVLTITGGTLIADVGLSLVNSKIDLAGVKICSKTAVASTNSDVASTIVFSVCEIQRGKENSSIHDIREITKSTSM